MNIRRVGCLCVGNAFIFNVSNFYRAMGKYRKKPVVIEAWIWDETKETFNQIGCLSMSSSGHLERPNEMTQLRILTLEGTMRVDKGDYIIKGVKGEFYPCKSDIFQMTYESVRA